MEEMANFAQQRVSSSFPTALQIMQKQLQTISQPWDMFSVSTKLVASLNTYSATILDPTVE